MTPHDFPEVREALAAMEGDVIRAPFPVGDAVPVIVRAAPSMLAALDARAAEVARLGQIVRDVEARLYAHYRAEHGPCLSNEGCCRKCHKTDCPDRGGVS